jgi:general nucleoside transport system permease protein
VIGITDLLRYSAPIAFAAGGECVGQRSGIINVGLEGMMLTACFTSTMTALKLGSPLVGMAVGAATGLVLALIFAWFVVRLAVDQIVAGTALNLLALGVTNTLFRASFGQTGKLMSVPTLPQFFGLDAGLLLLLLCIPLLAYGLFRTNWGLAIRAVGENPIAAEAAGFSVLKLRFGATAIAGTLAGLAGAYLALGVNGSFAENMTAGRGFVAIAMVTFGRWRPMYVLAACLLIGLAETMQFEFQARGSAVPAELLIALPYVLALVVLVIVGKGSAAPAALARPYRREQ